jgi:hypothetical protein
MQLGATMSIAFRQFITPWANTTPAVSGSFTPNAAGDVLLVYGLDYTNTGVTLTFTGTGGTYSTLQTINDNNVGATDAVGVCLSASGASQTATVASSTSGDFMYGALLDYSGVGSVSGALAVVSGPGTGTGAILGTSVSVPIGSVLVAITADMNGGTAITSPSGTNRASGTWPSGDPFEYCVTEYAGAGSAIQPSFTSASGDHDFIVAQWLLSPSGGSSHPSQFFLSSALAPLGALSWIIGRRNKLAGVRRSWRQDQKSRLFLPEYKRAA